MDIPGGEDGTIDVQRRELGKSQCINECTCVRTPTEPSYAKRTQLRQLDHRNRCLALCHHIKLMQMLRQSGAQSDRELGEVPAQRQCRKMAREGGALASCFVQVVRERDRCEAFPVDEDVFPGDVVWPCIRKRGKPPRTREIETDREQTTTPAHVINVHGKRSERGEGAGGEHVQVKKVIRGESEMDSFPTRCMHANGGEQPDDDSFGVFLEHAVVDEGDGKWGRVRSVKPCFDGGGDFDTVA